jgi:DnaK suppressor protein
MAGTKETSECFKCLTYVPAGFGVDAGSSAREETEMQTVAAEVGAFRAILGQKRAELDHFLRGRDDIAIEASADQMDEIQHASERDLAIQNVDRHSSLLREVQAALRRDQDGTLGICIDCESAISVKRMAAVPWASRCIRCQELADRDRQDNGNCDLRTHR